MIEMEKKQMRKHVIVIRKTLKIFSDLLSKLIIGFAGFGRNRIIFAIAMPLKKYTTEVIAARSSNFISQVMHSVSMKKAASNNIRKVFLESMNQSQKSKFILF